MAFKLFHPRIYNLHPFYSILPEVRSFGMKSNLSFGCFEKRMAGEITITTSVMAWWGDACPWQPKAKN